MLHLHKGGTFLYQTEKKQALTFEADCAKFNRQLNLYAQPHLRRAAITPARIHPMAYSFGIAFQGPACCLGPCYPRGPAWAPGAWSALRVLCRLRWWEKLLKWVQAKAGQGSKPGCQWDTFLSGSLISPLLGSQQGAGIHGQCKTDPSAPLPLSSPCQHIPITCSIGNLWKWPTAAWPSWHAWLTFSICHHSLCITVWMIDASKSTLFFLCLSSKA